MKIVTPTEMVRIEKLAYDAGQKEEALMLAAGQGIASALLALYQNIPQSILLLCGKGNNGGDGYVAGLELLKRGWRVSALHVGDTKESSPLCRKFHSEFLEHSGIATYRLEGDYDLILDALFGTGFHGEVKEPYAHVIKEANRSRLPIFSIDIPSGLDGESGNVQGEAIHAMATFTLSLPKQGFFLGQGWNHVGELIFIDIGIKEDLLPASSFMELETGEDLILPPLIRDRHKYQAGYVIGWGGSPGMPGAAIMAGLAALRSGAGIVKLLHSKGMEAELAATPYEIIRKAEQNEAEDLALLNKATAVFIGPGMGRDEGREEKLRALLPQITTRCVLDADALTMLSNDMCSLPPETVMTPHRGEMARLLGIPTPQEVHLPFLEQVQLFCRKHRCHLILKGAPSFMITPAGKISVFTKGDPGMATAGAGDVLTGILAGILSQDIDFEEAIKTALYLHGSAGEIAAEQLSSFSMIATDIIDTLAEAFIELRLREI